MDIVEQLRDAWVRSTLTLGELVAKSGLSMTPESLSRKLNGLRALRIFEIESLANALAVELGGPLVIGLGPAPPPAKGRRAPPKKRRRTAHAA